MITHRLRRAFGLGAKSLLLHKLRSALTVLGIVFGVCSVIAMLSIGEGARLEAEEQIKRLGSENIIVRSKKPPSTREGTQITNVVDYGIRYADVDRMRRTIPSIAEIVPARITRMEVRWKDRTVDARVVGTIPSFVRAANAPVAYGRFISDVDELSAENICVVGAGVARQLFPIDDPLGKDLKLRSSYYRIVGVMSEGGAATGAGGAIVAEDRNLDVYIPLSAARKRLGEILVIVTSGSRQMEKVELHQIIVRVDATENVLATDRAIRHLFNRFHKKEDWDVTVPLELLRQAERTQFIFSVTLGSIAAISLLVGGIGIMNIMLASITERTREIGIRRALGAKKRDIVVQFLIETVALSSSGGILGIIVGILIPLVVSHFTKMRTLVTVQSLVLSFGISASVGILFGLYPANRAAAMDPIEALRRE
ncbi:MAG: ABC transporter permease [Planctomycetes bacterium]|nr:ABC transporter permease [Planctomycetota bacterium]